MDKTTKKIEKHIQEIMKLLDNPVTESNKDTPIRIAKMYVDELFINRNNSHIEELDEKMKLFPNMYKSEMVIIKDISFSTICEHHWLPFNGTVSIGYVPSENIIGLSKIPRIVKYFSKKPQLQEQFTTEIGEYIKKILKPNAIFVEVSATHQCVSCRGVESNCTTKTFYKNTLVSYESAYEDFLKRI